MYVSVVLGDAAVVGVVVSSVVPDIVGVSEVLHIEIV